MLASDVTNPEFQGAVQNADSALFVEFYMFEPINQIATMNKSREAGRRIVVKDPAQPYVRIMKPGDNTSIMEIKVREDHKQRWPDKWRYFQITEGLIEDTMNIPGWKVEEWDRLKDDPEAIRNLKHMRFYTVEQIAGASDAQVQKIGLGGMGLREEAKRAVRDKIAQDVRKDFEDRERAMQKQIDDLKGLLMKTLEKPAPEVVAEPIVKVETEVSTIPEVQQKRRGRPKGSKNKPKA